MDRTRSQISACKLPHMHLFLPETNWKVLLSIQVILFQLWNPSQRIRTVQVMTERNLIFTAVLKKVSQR